MRKIFLKIIIILLVVSIIGTGVIVFVDSTIPVDTPSGDTITLSGEEVVTQ